MLSTRALMSVGLAGAVDDGGVLFLDQHLLRLAEVVERRLLELQAHFVGDHGSAREHRDVLQHRLAAIAEARRLDGGNLDDAADGVDHERRQRLALDVLGDDQQLAAALRNPLEQREQLADIGDLLVDQEDQRLVELGALALLIVDEVRREVAAIELHALDHFELVLQARALFDGDHAFLADLRHGIRNGLADALVGVRGDRADLRDRLRILAGLGELLQLLGRGGDRQIDAALQVHRIRARGDRLQALADDRLRENRGGGGAVAGLIGGVGRDFLHHLRAHVLELVLELDLLRDRDAVLRDGGGAEALVEHRVAALGSQRHLDGVRQNIHALEHARPGVVAETYVFSCHCPNSSVELDNDSANVNAAGGLLAFDHGHNVLFSHHDQLVAIHLHFGAAVLAEEDLVADLDVQRTNLAVLQDLALADGHDFPKNGLLGRRVRDDDAAWGLTLFFFALYDHTVMKGSNLHRTRLLLL